MKKIKLLFIGVLFSSLAFANSGHGDIKDTLSFVVTKYEASLYKLVYRSEEASDVVITILNKDEKVVFMEVIKKSDGFVRPYNFKKLPVGQYTFRIESESASHAEIIDLQMVPSQVAGLLR
jgi:hypothetical protein